MSRPADPVICCKNIQSEGPISFGQGCVVHPECSLIAEAGPIVFGEYNIIEEKVRIVNRIKRDEQGKPLPGGPMIIGSYNLFEVGTVIENAEVGSFNLFEHRSGLQPGAGVGNNCVVTATAVIKSGMKVPDGSVVYSEDRYRSNPNTQEEAFRQNIKSLIDELARSLPKFNQIQSLHR